MNFEMLLLIFHALTFFKLKKKEEEEEPSRKRHSIQHFNKKAHGRRFEIKYNYEQNV